MKKIVFSITSLDIGGAEKVLIDTVNSLCEDYEITVLTIYNNGVLEKELNEKIRLKSIYNMRYDELSPFRKKAASFAIYNKLFLKALLSDFKDEYDYGISFLEGASAYIIDYLNCKKKIAWIHTIISSNFTKSSRINNYGKIIANFDKVIAVSEESVSDIKDLYNIDAQIIDNCIDVSRIKNLGKKYPVEKGEKFTFLITARMTEAKGYLRLLDVHEKLSQTHDYTLNIIGDGELMQDIKSRIAGNNLKNIKLLGKLANPYPYTINADCILIPSVYEGASIVGVEAMIFNKYIISTNTAAAKVIDDYPNKLIVDNDFDGIYEGMKNVIENGMTCVDYEYINDSIIKVRRLFNE